MAQTTIQYVPDVLVRMNFHEINRIVSYQRRLSSPSFQKQSQRNESPVLVFDVSVEYQENDELDQESEMAPQHLNSVADLVTALSMILRNEQDQDSKSDDATTTNLTLPKLTLEDGVPTSPLVSPKRTSRTEKRPTSKEKEAFSYVPTPSQSRLASDALEKSTRIDTSNTLNQELRPAGWKATPAPQSGPEEGKVLKPIAPIAKNTDIRPLVSVSREPVSEDAQKLRMELSVGELNGMPYMPVRQGQGPFNSGNVMPGVLESMNSFAKVLEDVEILKTKMYADEQKVKQFKLKLTRMERNLAELSGENVGIAWEELGTLYSRLVGTSSWLDYYLGVIDGLRSENLNSTPLVSQSCLVMVQKDLEAIRVATQRYSIAIEYLVQRLVLAQDRTSGKVDPVLAAHANEPEEISTMFVDMLGDCEFVKALEKMGSAITDLFHRFNEKDISKIPSPGECKGTVAVLYLHLSPCMQFKSKFIRMKRKFEFQNRKAVNLGLQGLCCPMCMLQPKSKQCQVEQGMLFSRMVKPNNSNSNGGASIPEIANSGSRNKGMVESNAPSYSPSRSRNKGMVESNALSRSPSRSRPRSQQLAQRSLSPQKQSSHSSAHIIHGEPSSIGRSQIQFQSKNTASSHFPTLNKKSKSPPEHSARHMLKRASSTGIIY